MSGRLVAIGDIHGCLAAFEAVWAAVAPRPDDTVVLLGDYVDRGPDSRGVLERLIGLQSVCRLIPLLGNHDQMFIDICNGRADLLEDWLLFGGDATLHSYNTLDTESIPKEHIEFLQDCGLFYDTERHIFLHGSYDATLPLLEQDPNVLLWGKLRPEPPGLHCSGKTVIVGHTARAAGKSSTSAISSASIPAATATAGSRRWKCKPAKSGRPINRGRGSRDEGRGKRLLSRQ